MRQLFTTQVKSVSFLLILQHKLPQYSFSFSSLLQLCGSALVSALPPSTFPPHHHRHPAHNRHNTMQWSQLDPSHDKLASFPGIPSTNETYCKRPKTGQDLGTKLMTSYKLTVKTSHFSEHAGTGFCRIFATCYNLDFQIWKVFQPALVSVINFHIWKSRL